MLSYRRGGLLRRSPSPFLEGSAPRGLWRSPYRRGQWQTGIHRSGCALCCCIRSVAGACHITRFDQSGGGKRRLVTCALACKAEGMRNIRTGSGKVRQDHMGSIQLQCRGNVRCRRSVARYCRDVAGTVLQVLGGRGRRRFSPLPYALPGREGCSLRYPDGLG